MHDEELLAALGYEPVGFTKLTAAEALAGAHAGASMRWYVTSRGSSLGLAAVLHQVAPDLPIILASPSTHEFAAHVWAASGGRRDGSSPLIIFRTCRGTCAVSRSDILHRIVRAVSSSSPAFIDLT